MRIRIHGFASGIMDPGLVLDPDPDPNKFKFFFFLIFYKISYFFFENLIFFIIFVDSFTSLSRFFLVPGSRSTFPEVDRDPANDTDPTGTGSESGSETLILIVFRSTRDRDDPRSYDEQKVQFETIFFAQKQP